MSRDDRHWSDVPSSVSAGCCDACDVSLDVAEESRIVPGMCESCAEREIELDKAQEHANELRDAVTRAQLVEHMSILEYDALLRQWVDALEWLKECKGKMPAPQWPNQGDAS